MGFYSYNLETVPVSGRRRFNIISPEYEQQMGQQQLQQILAEYKGAILSKRDKRSQAVHRVLERLIPNSGLTDQKWEIFVIESEEQNAFVIPGGKVFVFTGILPICRDDDGIAAVLGHEIAHNVAHHGMYS
jgi:predicted Zn-dependent protease